MYTIAAVTDILFVEDVGDVGYIYTVDGGFVVVDLVDGDGVIDVIADYFGISVVDVVDAIDAVA